MFATEEQLQRLIFDDPAVLLNGIPEISPAYCGGDAPALVSLAREVQLLSGPLDNLFIDLNAVLTFVECKRYGDSRLKREVYAQAINYASDLRNMLFHYSGTAFEEELFRIIASGKSKAVKSHQQLLETLESDPMLAGKNLEDWRSQFRERLEHNIKDGVFRIVILCGTSLTDSFSAQMVRNLMQVMTFTENLNARYDLLLMDIREHEGKPASRILWRRYASLPEIPVIARAVRDTQARIEAMRDKMEALPKASMESLNRLLQALNENGYDVVADALGLAIYEKESRRSCYTRIKVDEEKWTVVRHQIRIGEPLFDQITTASLPKILTTLEPRVSSGVSTVSGVRGVMYQIEIVPDYELPFDVKTILGAICRPSM